MSRQVGGSCKETGSMTPPRGDEILEKFLPEENIWLRDQWIGRKEGDDRVCVSVRDRGEERGGVEGPSVEEVGRSCRIWSISNHGYR